MSLQLFDAPLIDAEIINPAHCANWLEFKHELKQVGVKLTAQQEIGCRLARRWARSKKPFFAQLVVWRNGRWACFHEECRREHPIAPGQYRKAYYASPSKEHFYHLETNTTKDLILHC